MLGLYVLARNVDEYYALYNDEVMEFLSANEFTKIYNSPVKIVRMRVAHIRKTTN